MTSAPGASLLAQIGSHQQVVCPKCGRALTAELPANARAREWRYAHPWPGDGCAAAGKRWRLRVVRERVVELEEVAVEAVEEKAGKAGKAEEAEEAGSDGSQ